MPLPKTRNIGKTIKFLKKDKPSMPRKQKTAIALNTARRAGANIPKSESSRKRIGGQLRAIRSRLGGRAATRRKKKAEARISGILKKSRAARPKPLPRASSLNRARAKQLGIEEVLP